MMRRIVMYGIALTMFATLSGPVRAHIPNIYLKLLDDPPIAQVHNCHSYCSGSGWNHKHIGGGCRAIRCMVAKPTLGKGRYSKRR
jgi:hypothetical protein